MAGQEDPAEPGWWKRVGGGLASRLKRGLAKTRSQLAEGVGNLLLGRKAIDARVLGELEAALLRTDVGVATTTEIMARLAARTKRSELADTVALFEALRAELIALLEPVAKPFVVDATQKPFVILVVGVNGAGKTTTIGKLSRRLKGEGHSVLLAAGDTFRAAAVEQLQSWGERNHISVVAQGQGADSASVVFDAVQAARARAIDVVIADTAGRLQAKTSLMDELTKVKRVLGKIDARAPHQVLLVLDAGIGQNALSQVKEFDAAVGLTGLAIAKLDGTAKAGALFAIARQWALPVYFIGVGEGADDLAAFDAQAFVDALLEAREPRAREAEPR